MQHPFQCLAVAKPPDGPNAYLLAACGPRLSSTSLGNDPTQSEWSATPAASERKETQTEGPPAKKQKTAAPTTSANVIKLTVSPDGQHAVVVTEDKLVRVFEISALGNLSELSQRAMPKRPCAIEVLPDNATILCGDKFGDVYSLPLLPLEQSEHSETIAGADGEVAEKNVQAFKPSASHTTVHTKRNRKALEAQLKQKNLTAKSKVPLEFDQKLLLGHVSMLTDLAFATREVEGKQRGYIITADRDEHIRISRGPPQSHVIEGYCLGHAEYVSKICLVSGRDLLVSGGGDDWIGVWDWPSFKLRRKLDVAGCLRDALERSAVEVGGLLSPPENVNVSGMWIVPLRARKTMELNQPTEVETATEQAVIVSCEKVPALFVCPVAELASENARFYTVTEVGAPILDVASFEEKCIAMLDDRKNASRRAVSFTLEMNEQNLVKFVADDALSKALEGLNIVPADVENEKMLDRLLYGVANLRKRGHQNVEQDGDVEDGVDAPVDDTALDVD